jgi:hypothetical protein
MGAELLHAERRTDRPDESSSILGKRLKPAPYSATAPYNPQVIFPLFFCRTYIYNDTEDYLLLAMQYMSCANENISPYSRVVPNM